MKVVQINDGCGVGSIGKICVAVSEILTKRNIENYIFYTYGESSYPLGIKYTNKLYTKEQALFSRIRGDWGFVSKKATQKLVCQLKSINPSIIHLHNLHGHNVNLEILFDFVRQNGIKIFWTFHDCWAFTGYCVYFDMAKCTKWESGCHDCPQRKKYTWFFDKSNSNWNRKKKILEGIDLSVITPSEWLADLVKRSFFSEFPVLTINNGINLDIFKPTESDFRDKYNCKNKVILLGVAFDWSPRKGLDVFIEAYKKLDEKYQIVLVGTNDEIDKILPKGIISIHRTQNQQELAQIYTAADLFVNPTREENYPTVNMESVACGTPVLTFNTGGSAEMLDEHCGIVVERGDICALLSKIEKIGRKNNDTSSYCVRKAAQYKAADRFEEYVSLYMDK